MCQFENTLWSLIILKIIYVRVNFLFRRTFVSLIPNRNCTTFSVGSADFFGLNFYSTYYISESSEIERGFAVHTDTVKSVDSSWKMYALSRYQCFICIETKIKFYTANLFNKPALFLGPHSETMELLIMVFAKCLIGSRTTIITFQFTSQKMGTRMIRAL